MTGSDVAFTRILTDNAMLVSATSVLVDLCNDGFFTIPCVSSLVFSLVLCCSPSIPSEAVQQRSTRLEVVANCFSMTFLALIRVAFLSLREEGHISLYFAYLSLFVAFTDNLNVLKAVDALKELEDTQRHPRPVLRHRRAAAAG